jgi:hypothetical protein
VECSGLDGMVEELGGDDREDWDMEEDEREFLGCKEPEDTGEENMDAPVDDDSINSDDLDLDDLLGDEPESEPKNEPKADSKNNTNEKNPETDQLESQEPGPIEVKNPQASSEQPQPESPIHILVNSKEIAAETTPVNAYAPSQPMPVLPTDPTTEISQEKDTLIQRLQFQLHSMTSHAHSLEERLSKLTQKKSKDLDDLTLLNDQREAELLGDLSNLTGQLEEKSIQIDALRTENSSLKQFIKTQASETETRNTAAQKEITSLKDTLETHKTKIKYLNEDKTKLGVQLKLEFTQNRDSIQQISTLTSLVDQKTDQASIERNAKIKADRETFHHRTQALNLTEKNKSLITDLANLKTELDTAKAKLTIINKNAKDSVGLAQRCLDLEDQIRSNLELIGNNFGAKIYRGSKGYNK